MASEFGLPVSSTHIAVGGIFGVGFYREFHTNRYVWHWHALSPGNALASGGISTTGAGDENGEVAANGGDVEPQLLEKRRRKAEKARNRRLVRRRHLLTIVAAWLVTVPLAALLSAAIFGVWSVFV